MSGSIADAPFDTLRRRAYAWTTVCVVTGAVAFTGNFLPDEWLGVPAVALLVCGVTAWPAYRFRKRLNHALRQRSTQPISVEQIAAFAAPPVLYLRSFEDDEQGARIKGEWTEEEHLRSVLTQIGPFVAIGRPGESLPTVGASRVYVGDAHWQETVEHLLRSARLVIVRTGSTAGLQWEVDRVIRLLTPDRLVLLVDSRRELRTLLATIRTVHQSVPRHVWVGWRSIGTTKGFVVFDSEWRPTCLRAKGPGPYFLCDNMDGVGYATKRLAWTLRPLFRRQGMTWSRPPLNWGFIVTGSLAGLLFLASIVLNLLKL